jgi:hypothetical protein
VKRIFSIVSLIVLLFLGTEVTASPGRSSFEHELSVAIKTVQGRAGGLAFWRPASPLVRGDSEPVYFALHLKAIEILSDVEAAEFLTDGRETVRFRIPSLIDLGASMTPEQLYRLVTAMALKGPRTSEAGFQFLKGTPSFRQRGRSSLEFGRFVGDRGDDLEVLKDGFRSIDRLLIASPIGDADRDYIWRLFVGGVLTGSSNTDRSRASVFADNLEIVFHELNEDQQVYLASRLTDVHSDHAYDMIESLVKSSNRHAGEIAISGLIVSRDSDAPRLAIRLMKAHAFDSKTWIVRNLSVRLLRDAEQGGATMMAAEEMIREMRTETRHGSFFPPRCRDLFVQQ